MKAEQERVRALLVDTITLLCKNGLTFTHDLKVQGLLGITVDNQDVFVVHLNDVLSADASSSCRLSTAIRGEADEINSTSHDDILSAAVALQRNHFPLPLPRKRPRNSKRSPNDDGVCESDSGPAHRDSELMPSSSGTKTPMVNNSGAMATQLKRETQAQEPGQVMFIESDDDESDDILDPKFEGGGDLEDGQSILTATTWPLQARGSAMLNRKRMRSSELRRSTVKAEPDIYRGDGSAGVGGGWNASGEEFRGEEVEDGVLSQQGIRGLGRGVKWDPDGRDYENGEGSFGAPSTAKHHGASLPNFPGGGADGGPFDDFYDGMPIDGVGSMRCQYDDCGRTFNYKRSLDRHQRSKHGAIYGATGQMCFYCSVPACRRVFYKEANLHKHQRDQHAMGLPPLPPS